MPRGEIIKKKLPADLPQTKLLFITYEAAEVPSQRPKGMNPMQYGAHKDHNSVIGEANTQLQETAAQYPYAYRITTDDSIAYYQDHGYKYLFFNSSFYTFIAGEYIGYNPNRGTLYPESVDAYIRDLTTNDKYVFNFVGERDTYKYRVMVEMLLKKIAKQF